MVILIRLIVALVLAAIAKYVADLFTLTAPIDMLIAILVFILAFFAWDGNYQRLR